MKSMEDMLSRAAATIFVQTLGAAPAVASGPAAIPDPVRFALARLNLTEQQALIERARYYLAVEVDHQALERQVSVLEAQRDHFDLENTFLLCGAPLVLMRRLFGMHAADFSRRRQALNLQGSGCGRPAQCDEATEHRIWRLWRSLGEVDDRQRFLCIAEETGLDLHHVWRALSPYLT